MYICTGQDYGNAIDLINALEVTSSQECDWQSFISLSSTDEQSSEVTSRGMPSQPSLTSVCPDVWKCSSYTHALDSTYSSYSSAQFEEFVQLDKHTSDHLYAESPDSSLATLDSPQISPWTIDISNMTVEPSSTTNMTDLPSSFAECLTMDIKDDMAQHLTLADLLGPPAPQCVTLRTTGVCADMKLRMGVFRLDPFSMHDGLNVSGTLSTAVLAEHAVMVQKHDSLLRDHVICWDGEMAQPLKEKSCFVEFQVELDDPDNLVPYQVQFPELYSSD